MFQNDRSDLYDEYYYQHCCGSPYERTPEWLHLFAGIADKIVREIAPRSVLDAGCAKGFLVEALRQRGVEAFGIDISEYAIRNVAPEIRPYCQVGAVTNPFPRRYELIVCIEVFEHLMPHNVERAVENLCAHTDDVLFSSTPFDYKEPTHINVQPPEYWAELFSGQGFFRDVDFDVSSIITPWAVRFRRKHEPVRRIVRDYERKFWHLWKENVDLRHLVVEMRDQLADLEQSKKMESKR